LSGKERRDFTMLDLMALVAAAAVGFSTARVYWAEVLSKVARPGGYYLHDRLAAGAGFLGSYSVALMALRSIPPRPRWRRIARQPGTVASLSASVVLLLSLPNVVIAYWRQGPTGGIYMSWVVLFDYVPKEIGAAVGAAWAVAATTGHWRPEPTWIDRAGRALGAAWIAYLLVQSALESLII
jgi:hypothetical protein